RRASARAASARHFNHPTPTATYTLSLHDALPIWRRCRPRRRRPGGPPDRAAAVRRRLGAAAATAGYDRASRAGRTRRWRQRHRRSEEHTSELQSLTNLVCRLLVEKKKHMTHTAAR